MRRLLPLLLLLAIVPSAHAQGEGQLRDQIGAGKARERQLAGAAARLGRLERQTAREVTVLEGRLGAAQADLTAAQTRLTVTQTKLAAARRRVARLRRRLAEVRVKLSALLRARYMGDQPDFVTVVLHSDGFPQLLDTLSFVRRVERADTRLLALVRSARTDADREQATLSALSAQQFREAAAVKLRRDALAGITDGLRARRDAYASARSARLAALGRTRAGRLRAQGVLNRLLAARARAMASGGPGGPWAIPWPIVQCESGGQNTPPNYASASGYYQILDSTWHGLGGSTPHAYQASKAEQDRLAARLWAGGAGRHNWVCASLVAAV